MGKRAREVRDWSGDDPSGVDAEQNLERTDLEAPEYGATDETTGEDVARLVDDIETTRGEMTVTVEEIGDRLDPRNIVADAKETVRDATVGKVEQMASSAEEMVRDAGETVQEAGSGLVDTIRRNPIPAAMVGVGLGWLAMSARQASSGSRSWSGYDADRRYRYPAYAREGWTAGPGRGTDAGGREALYSETSGATSGGSGIGDRAGEMADQMGHTVERKVDEWSRTAGDAGSQVQDMARQVGDNAGRMYRDNPLAMGAVAVAVGTAIGLALPATQMERRTIGQPARQLLDKAEETAADALGQAEQGARDVEQQARTEEGQARPH